MAQASPVDWIHAVEKTDAEAAFHQLATDIELDTKARNERPDVEANHKFGFKREGLYVAVYRDVPMTRVTYAQVWPVRLVRLFVPDGAPGQPRRLLAQEEEFGNDKGTEFEIALGVDDHGDLRFQVDVQWLTGWQLRMVLLQRLFFGRTVTLVPHQRGYS